MDNLASLHLHDRSGKRLLERLAEIAVFSTPFSPDLDGRYLVWGNEGGYVSVADLVEVQRRLAEINLTAEEVDNCEKFLAEPRSFSRVY
jgi:hypothetical protein